MQMQQQRQQQYANQIMMNHLRFSVGFVVTVLIFSFRNLDKAQVEMGSIHLRVMDANTLFRADLIGATHFDLSYIYAQEVPDCKESRRIWGFFIPENPSSAFGSDEGCTRAGVNPRAPGASNVPGSTSCVAGNNTMMTANAPPGIAMNSGASGMGPCGHVVGNRPYGNRMTQQ
ncbi:hypothetical protein PsorP6_006760 [Peronosclerospora sorghi]|uniref:Uncharacterized protein n=1 Tax=Peronosclerospora sorghi TaxID=230839 RepID=A0ACC0W320_9STRA|nr:hypothetical protein PsorP6_006760 [Peronosclerospora sorghi]